MFEQWVFYIMVVSIIASVTTGFVIRERPHNDTSLSGQLLIVIFVSAVSVSVGSTVVLVLVAGGLVTF